MPQRFQTFEGFVLSKSPSGENFMRLLLLTRDHGLVVVLKRESKRMRFNVQPDLFDLASAETERRAEGPLFVKDYRLIKRHSGIAANYHAFRHASSFCKYLILTLPYLGATDVVFDLLAKALGSWESDEHPEVTSLKSLYLLARDEGYPVKQDWLASLSESERAMAAELLRKPVAEQRHARREVERLYIQLQHWFDTQTGNIRDPEPR